MTEIHAIGYDCDCDDMHWSTSCMSARPRDYMRLNNGIAAVETTRIFLVLTIGKLVVALQHGGSIQCCMNDAGFQQNRPTFRGLPTRNMFTNHNPSSASWWLCWDNWTYCICSGGWSCFTQNGEVAAFGILFVTFYVISTGFDAWWLRRRYLRHGWALW